MKKIYYMFLVVLIGCAQIETDDKTSRAQTKTFASWPTTINLTSTPVKLLSENLSFPISINAIGNYLVFLENTNSEQIKIFSLNDYTYKGSFGRAGQGPNEFAGITAVIQDESKNKPYLTFYDWGKKLISKYNIDQLAQNKDSVVPLKTYVLPPKLIQAHQVLFSPRDSSVIGFGGFDVGKLVKYDTKADSIEKITPFIPKINYSSDKYKLGMVYRGSIALNPFQSKIAVVSRLFKQLEIYDLDLNLIKATQFGEDIDVVTREPNSRMEIRTSSNSTLNYTDLDYTDENIFVFYENRTLDEMNKDICKNSEIHTFDWQGNPTIRYKLEDCPNFFAYDHINKRFIGIFVFTDEENQLIRYYQL